MTYTVYCPICGGKDCGTACIYVAHPVDPCAELRTALERLARVSLPQYETDDCHEHADAAEARILLMRDAAREALAALRPENERRDT